MKKLFFIAFFMTGITVTLLAQPSKKIIFGAGIRAGLPVSDFEEFTSFGAGIVLQGEYGFSNVISGVATTGYTSFFGKDYGGGKTKATGYVPILVGPRLYPVKRFFLDIQIGYGLLTSSGNSDGYFNYQPQVGYNAARLQVAIHYNSLSEKGGTLNHLGVAGIFKFR